MAQAPVGRTLQHSAFLQYGAIHSVPCHASPSSSRGVRCAAPKKSPSRAARRSTAATAGTRRSPSRKSSRASSPLKRYIRAHSAEKYLIYHSTLKRPCGQLIVVDDGYDLFLTLMLYPNFGWDEPAYHLEGDPEGRLFSELLVDVVAAEVIEPWGGGKWHMEIFRSVNPEPEDWNGEM